MRLSRRRIALWRRVVSGTRSRRLFGPGLPGRLESIVGVVILIRRLILGGPGLVILGRFGRGLIVGLRCGRSDLRDLRRLALRYPRPGPVVILIRILIYILVWWIVLSRSYRVGGGIVSVSVNNRLRLILAGFGTRRGSWMHRQDRRADELRTIHDQRGPVMGELFVFTTPRRISIPGLNGNGMNHLAGDPGDMLWRDARVDDAVLVVVKTDVVNDLGLVVNAGYFGRVDAVMLRMRIAKILCWHKSKRAGGQTEIEAHRDRLALIKESDAGVVDCMRR